MIEQSHSWAYQSYNSKDTGALFTAALFRQAKYPPTDEWTKRCGIYNCIKILEWIAHFLLQGIFPTQGSNLQFLHYRQILYRLSHQGSPFGQWWKWKWKSLSRVRPLWPHGLESPWNSPGQNTRVGSCSLLQGIFPAQGSNPGLQIWPAKSVKCLLFGPL